MKTILKAFGASLLALLILKIAVSLLFYASGFA